MAVSGIIINGVSLSTSFPILLSHCLHISLPLCLSDIDCFSFTYLFLEVEWIPTRERTLVGTLTSFFFTFGQMILAGLAYWLRDWRKLQVVVCAPHFLFFAYSWSVASKKHLQNSLLCVYTGGANTSAFSSVRWYSESARWLVLRNRFDDALKNLQRVARINGKPEVIDKLTKEVTHLSL